MHSEPKRWRYRLTYILLLLLALPLAGEQVPASELEAFFDGIFAVDMREHNAHSAVISVVADGEIRFSRGYGSTERGGPRVDPAGTLFRPGSVSKLITWTAVMQLAEQGKVDLHTDVNEYLDFEIPGRVARSRFRRESTPDEPVTLHHLLTHTGGFEDRLIGLFTKEAKDMSTLEEYLKENVPKRVYTPGRLAAYSNYGSALAGYIVERISGLRFEEYVRTHIFEPLEMSSSTFEQPLPGHLEERLAGGYNFVEGAFRRGGFEFIPASPAGALTTSARDMARFMIAHLQLGAYRGERILEEETLRSMHERHFSHHEALPGMTRGFFESQVNGRRIIHHGGDTFLFHSELFLVPEENIGVFVSYTGSGAGRAHLFHAFMDRYLPDASKVTDAATAADSRDAGNSGRTADAPGSDDAPDYTPADAPGSDDNTSGYTPADELARYAGEYHTTRRSFSDLSGALALAQSLRVAPRDDGGITISAFGEQWRLHESSPGRFTVDEGAPPMLGDSVALYTDSEGRRILALEGAFSFEKAPWYRTTTFTSLALGLSVILLGLTLFGRPVRYLLRRFVPGIAADRSAWVVTPSSQAARWTSTFVILILLIYLTGLVVIVQDIDPVLQLPELFFGLPAAWGILHTLAYLLVPGTLAMAVFSFMAWRGRWWLLTGRLHYSALTAALVVVVWIGMLWNAL